MTSAANLFAASNGGGVFLSTDNGTSWTAASTGLTTPSVLSLAVSGTNLDHNYLNPFNPATTISFSFPTGSFVSVKVFDALGREVSILVADELPAGTYTRRWNAAAFPSGVYFYRLQAGSFIETKKLVLLR